MKNYWSCYLCSCFSLIIVLGLGSFTVNYFLSWLLICVSVIIIFIEAKKEKANNEEGQYFYPKICRIILLVLITSIIFSVRGYSSKLFLLACTNILVIFSKQLEKIEIKKN